MGWCSDLCASVLSVIDSPGCCLHASWSFLSSLTTKLGRLATFLSWRACTSAVFFLLCPVSQLCHCAMSLSAWNKEWQHTSLCSLLYKSIPSWFLVFNSVFTVKVQAPLWHWVFWSLACFSGESYCVYWHSSLIDGTCFSWCMSVVGRIELFSYMWANQDRVFFYLETSVVGRKYLYNTCL